MFKIVVFIIESHLEAVKHAMFDAGAGAMGNYDHCCWQVLGQGQFRPCPGSQPFLGQAGEVEQVDEYRVEMLCPEDTIEMVIAAMKKAHPFEHPAYEVIRLEAF